MDSITEHSQDEWQTETQSKADIEVDNKAQEQTAQSKDTLKKVLTATKQREQYKTKDKKQITRYPYTMTGKIISCESNYQAIVSFELDKQQYQYTANTTVRLNETHQKLDCVLSFNQGYLNQPIIMGIIQSEKSIQAQDSQALVLSSNQGVSLECGASRIELDENGTINIQGMHINSQAYGPHHIKGGSVKIN